MRGVDSDCTFTVLLCFSVISTCHDRAKSSLQRIFPVFDVLVVYIWGNEINLRNWNCDLGAMCFYAAIEYVGGAWKDEMMLLAQHGVR